MDPRIHRLAKLLVGYSTKIGVGDRVLLQADHEGAPLVRALFEQVLEHGGYPVMLLSLDGMQTDSGIDDLFMEKADREQLSFVSPLLQYAYDHFESRIRIESTSNVKSIASVDPQKVALRRSALKPVLDAQFTRGDAGLFRWVTTRFPTQAYAQMADMSLGEYEDFLYQACHVNDPQSDPIEYWQTLRDRQQEFVDHFQGGDRLVIRSPDCELALSIAGRTFINGCGTRNMPDGEVFTGPVEESVEGWIHFNAPAVYRGVEVKDVKLKFQEGRVVEATATKNQYFLEKMLDTDASSRYLGELGIGTNYAIQQYTKSILFDEKIGGTFHIALGSGYPITGSKNSSAIHWDLICYVDRESEFVLDGEVIYRNGRFTI